MTLSPASPASSGLGHQARLALRFALRELRGGLSGFGIFIACIALGTGAIGGVNSVADAITQGVASEGRTLLGGDIRFQLNQREASEAESRFLESLGPVASSAAMRSMVRLADGSDQTLAEVKAVDDAYPLAGSLVTEPQLSGAALYGERDGAFGAAAPQLLFDRLNLKTGDKVRLGSATFEMRAVIVTEPDLVSDGFGFAPRLLVSLEALRASGLIQPGSLVEHSYKVDLGASNGPSRIAAIREAYEESGIVLARQGDYVPSLELFQEARSLARAAGELENAGFLSMLVAGTQKILGTSSDAWNARAEARGEAGYIDPRSGLFVLTGAWLAARGSCCGKGCRHCPYPPEEQRRAGRPQSG